MLESSFIALHGPLYLVKITSQNLGKAGYVFAFTAHVDNEVFIFPHRKGQSCNHVAATLFAVSHYKTEGIETVPADKTCTEFRCRWKGHAAKKTAPAPLDDIKIVK